MDRSQYPELLPREAASHQVVAGDIPSEPPGFQPRTALLAELDRVRALVPVVHFVTGPSGAGKTTLAAAYAREKLAAGWRLVAWVNAGDTLSLLAGLARTAEAAGLNGSDTGRSASDPGQLVRRRLEADGDRCLLVFDDARDPDLLQPFVPAYGAARVLITGPRRLSAIQAISVPVDAFSGNEAAAFLTQRTGRVDPEGAAALAAELGHVPLALAQAASVIFGQSLGYRSYLEQLRAVPIGKSPSRELGQPSVPAIVQAVLPSLEFVSKVDETGTCTRLIEFLAVLSAAGVRRDLLHAAGQAWALAGEGHQVAAALVDEALARLAELSLVTASLDGRMITVHRSVMVVVRTELARRQRLAEVCRLAASVLEARAGELAVSPDRSALRDIPGQVSALVDNAAGPVGEDEELARALLRLLATAYWDVGPDATEKTSAEAIPAAVQLPPYEEVLPHEEIVPDEGFPQDEQVLPDQEVLSDQEVLPDAEVLPDQEIVRDEEVLPDAEVLPDQEIPRDEEVPQGECEPPTAEVPPAEAEPGPSSATPGDLEPERSVPEPSARPDVRSGRRPGRLSLRAVGLIAAILILLAAGGTALAISQPPGAGRPSANSAAPALGPVQMAAGWVSQQVSRSAIVACDPTMCTALEARGVTAANLLVLRSPAASPLAAQVVVATQAVRSQFGGRLESVYAPAVMASFGSGPGRVSVQVIAPQGSAAYLTALSQDVAARKVAGAELLANTRIAVAAGARALLAAGEIDSRLLILLPALAAVHPIQVLAFGDPGPGASQGVPWCSADLSGSGRVAGMTDAGYVSWLTTFVRAQLLPFAGTITTLRLGGQLIVRIEYSRPSPLGLLTQ